MALDVLLAGTKLAVAGNSFLTAPKPWLKRNTTSNETLATVPPVLTTSSYNGSSTVEVTSLERQQVRPKLPTVGHHVYNHCRLVRL